MSSMFLAMSPRSMIGDLSASISDFNVGGGVWVSQVSRSEVKQALVTWG